MNVELIEKAVELIGDKQLLINIVSKRVQQLNDGADPYVAVDASTGAGDIALMEIVAQKITWRRMNDAELAGDETGGDFDYVENEPELKAYAFGHDYGESGRQKERGFGQAVQEECGPAHCEQEESGARL